MNRREFMKKGIAISIVSGIVPCVFSGTAAQAALAGRKPNIIL